MVMGIQRSLHHTILAGLAAVVCAGCAGTKSQSGVTAKSSDQPRLYSGFGNYERKVTTTSPEAQKWFNQGIQLLYGFNHDEAIRSFRQAATIDPECAMAWWGISYAHGLHINNPEMTEEQSRGGYDAAQEAIKRINNATPVEQALIQAVAARYDWPPPKDRKPLDEAYMKAMGEAWKSHNNDADVGALYAESMMNLQPWDLWTHDGKPKGNTEKIVATLERVLTLNVNHPGANHFYIHAVEASPSPDKALPAADRLSNLVPGSGHLVHMPSHIYVVTGQYQRAAESNERAIKIDEDYFKLAPPPRFYNLYYVHNIHFLAYASMMEGRYQVALDAARRMEKNVPEAFLREHTKLADGLMPAVFHVMVRFGKWEDILNEPAYPDYRKISNIERIYARGVALAALGRTTESQMELKKFDELAATIDDEWKVGQNFAKDVLPIARRMMEGELLYRLNKRNEAFSLLREAVKMEEDLVYDEPPGWMQPVRHALGALLMGDAKAAEAEEVYRADLERHPNNAWALLGLEQSLRAQGKAEEAAKLEPQLKAAWARADVKPTSSCYCAPGKQLSAAGK